MKEHHPSSTSARQRADVLLAEKGLAESREQAKRLIMAGQVFLGAQGQGQMVQKPGQMLPSASAFWVREPEKYVSRGGRKLETALRYFRLDVHEITALDVGASTGGFTDCLLQHGARRVYALDVGYGQLHWRLRQNERVVCMERINIRHAETNLLPETVDLVVVDCSFISLRLVLPPCLRFLAPQGRILALVKPQFEVGPNQTDKGVVRDRELRLETVENISAFARDELGLTVMGHVPSDIRGPKGNQEYIIHLVTHE